MHAILHAYQSIIQTLYSSLAFPIRMSISSLYKTHLKVLLKFNSHLRMELISSSGGLRGHRCMFGHTTDKAERNALFTKPTMRYTVYPCLYKQSACPILLHDHSVKLCRTLWSDGSQSRLATV